MDPVTQGLVGALCAQAGGRRRHMKQAAVVGLVAGMAPDLDVLIRSSSDSLLAIEYHRHFTHALAFVPVGALLVALLLWPFVQWYGRWRDQAVPLFARVYLWSLLGFASHGLLDAMTSYGTHLLWPFSHERIAWNVISVIDPLFTMPLILLLGLALWRNSRLLAGTAALWAVFYLGWGAVQQHRAEHIVAHWAEASGIMAERVVAKPAFANLVLWRGLVDDGELLHSVAVRIVPTRQSIVWPGSSVQRVDPSEFEPRTRLRSDLERFAHFSDGWTFRYFPYEGDRDQQRSWFIGDFRYAIDPASQRPLWGIRFNPDRPDQPVAFERPARVTEAERAAFFGRLRGDWVD
ncbi:MAG: metal-dependent hydrolase [Pseudomonadota bacterium]